MDRTFFKSIRSPFIVEKCVVFQNILQPSLPPENNAIFPYVTDAVVVALHLSILLRTCLQNGEELAFEKEKEISSS